MNSVSFLNLCKVTTCSIFDRMARNLQQRMIAAYERNSSMDTQRTFLSRQRRVAGANAISSTVALASTDAKQPVRESFKPLRDLAIHTDD